MEKVLQYKQERAKLVEEARGILNRVEEEKRSLGADEKEHYNKIDSKIDELGDLIKKEERLSSFEAELEKREEVRSKPEPQKEQRGENTDYDNAFWKAMRQTRNALDANEVRALNIAVDAEGGYLAPDEFSRNLRQLMTENNVMRGLATVIETGSGDRTIPFESDYGQAYWTSENAAYTESQMTFETKTLSAYKLTSLVKVSEELLNDSFFNLSNYISQRFATRMAEKEEEAYISGDGTGKPTGFLTDAQLGVTAGSATAITFDEIIELFHSLKRGYRTRARFMMGDSTAKAVRKLKDSNGQYIWQPSVQVGQPDRILGKSIVVSENMPDISTGNKAIAFGDFSKYVIADRQGTALQRLNELYATNGQVGFKAFKRVDGKLLTPEAIKTLNMA